MRTANEILRRAFAVADRMIEADSAMHRGEITARECHETLVAAQQELQRLKDEAQRGAESLTTELH